VTKTKRVVAYLKSHLKAEVGGAVSLASFLVTHNLISMSADRAAAVTAVLTWISIHIVPNIPTITPEGNKQ
jgi:hypothetical protein